VDEKIAERIEKICKLLKEGVEEVEREKCP